MRDGGTARKRDKKRLAGVIPAFAGIQRPHRRDLPTVNLDAQIEAFGHDGWQLRFWHPNIRLQSVDRSLPSCIALNLRVHFSCHAERSEASRSVVLDPSLCSG